MPPYFKHVIVLALILQSCNNNHSRYRDRKSRISTDTLLELELQDSNKLTHFTLNFYKSASGHLYEKTIADKESESGDTLISVEYFNGDLPQDIDPLSFTVLNGWYAKDKNNAYLYRPTSGGMLISEIDVSDVNSFNILQGHYNYAFDNKHVFKEGEILENINPLNLKIDTDSHGFVTKITSGKIVYDAND